MDTSTRHLYELSVEFIKSNINLQIPIVENFMFIGRQPCGGFHAEQATKQIGFCCEELGEILQAIHGGCVDSTMNAELEVAIVALERIGKKLKAGQHVGDLSRANRAKLLDGAFDLSWVATGAMCVLTDNPVGAFREGALSNYDKFRNGVIRDENGKIQKPADWKEPDFEQFVK